MTKRFIASADSAIIRFTQKMGMPFARISLFIVFFWFGILKLFAVSPADPLVANLLGVTVPVISFEQFILWLGVYEMAIGIIFLIPKLERVAILLLLPHIAVTVAPLIFLPSITWQQAFVPTLEGQYIIKNVLIIALALGIAAHLEPIKNK